MNVHKIPLYYISFQQEPDLEDNFSRVGFQNINWFPAIDGRKLDPYYLLNNKLITLRSFNDLFNGRSEHSGMTSLGAVGCAMSHASLWKKCVEDKLPAIIIAESDYRFNSALENKHLQDINKALHSPKGVFVGSSKITRNKNDHTEFMGLRFYALTQKACEALYKHAFPISVQADFYVAGMGSAGQIDLDGYPLPGEQLQHKSTIQTPCTRCYLPKSPWVYVGVIAGIIVLLVIAGILFWKYRKCKARPALSPAASSGSSDRPLSPISPLSPVGPSS